MAPLRLSPSAINTYFRSPRLFYYQYILKMKSPPNIHLYKGSFIHKILEDLFVVPQYKDLPTFFSNKMKSWEPPEKIIEHMSEADLEYDHKADTELILSMFANRFEEKIAMVINEGKARDKNHAWNLLRPKFREHKIFDKERNVVGIIDSIETDYSNHTYIIDYKTSKLFRHTLPEDYIRQVSIYAYLFLKENGVLPDYSGIHYLRYGEIFLIPITKEIIEQAKKDIDFVREKTKSRDINDYPKGTDEYALRDIEYFEQKLGTIDLSTI